MNTRPTFEHVTDDGEVIDLAKDTRTPLQVAKSDLAAFKFKLLETVVADPRVCKAPCAAVVIVLMSFVTIDQKTLKPTPAYASLITLMVRGGLKEASVRVARKLLETHGYLVATGSKTKDGCTKYRLENPHVERVAAHVHEATEYIKEQVAESRAEERRRKQAKTAVGAPHEPTEQPRGCATRTAVGAPHEPNYLIGNLSMLGSEEKALPRLGSALSVYGQEDDPHVPYPVPETEDALAAMLNAIGQVCAPSVMGYFRKQLVAGKLTPAMVEQQRRRA